MSDKVVNSRSPLCLLEGWNINEEDIVGAIQKLDETHAMLAKVAENTNFLPTIAASNEEIKNFLMSAATGKDHVPMSVVNKLVKIGGTLIFALVSVIVFLLIGRNLGFLPNLH